MRILIFCLSICCALGQVPAAATTDEVPPQIGEKMSAFSLNDVVVPNITSYSLKDVGDKILILDFWSLGCRTCIQRYPKLAEIQEEYADDIQIVVVGNNGSVRNKGIKEFFKRVMLPRSNKIVAAFDSTLFDRWKITSVPHIYIVGRDGVLLHITDGRDMTKEKIAKLIKGEKVSFYQNRKVRPLFQPHTTIEGNSVIASAVLTRWNGEKQYSGFSFDGFEHLPDSVKSKGWSVAMCPLYGLFNYAFFGKWDWLPGDTSLYGRVAPYPVLEINDDTAFQFDFDVQPTVGTYNCYIKLPPESATSENLKAALRTLLLQAFPFDASIQTRDMPVLRLVAGKNAGKRLTAGAGAPSIRSTPAGVQLRNCLVKDLVKEIGGRSMDENQIPVVDATGITTRINITLEEDFNDEAVLQAQLSRYGLSLEKATMPMKVLVIKERK